MELIEKEFKNTATIRGHSLYFEAKDVINIVLKCRQLNKEILGIEAFIITDKKTQVQDYIDYTSEYYKQWEPLGYLEKYHIQKDADRGHWEEAIKFISDRSKSGYLFEINTINPILIMKLGKKV